MSPQEHEAVMQAEDLAEPPANGGSNSSADTTRAFGGDAITGQERVSIAEAGQRLNGESGLNESVFNSRTSPLPVLLTVTEVADFAQLHHSTIRAAVGRGEIVASRLGGQLRFHLADIEAWRIASYVSPTDHATVELPEERSGDDYRW
jgi:excisionase family DNA binding protein